MDAHELLNWTLSVYTSFYAAMAKALLKRRTKRKVAGAGGVMFALKFLASYIKLLSVRGT